MHKLVILLVALLFNLPPSAQGQPESWIGIDCGANRSTTTFGFVWDTDQDYIKSGTNRFIPDDVVTPLAMFRTVRAFTDQNKNCYTLPISSSYGYFIRATFFYANYDGQSRPPTFDLEIDGNKWTSVVTSPTDYTYYEILYWPQNRNISVCLARTQSDQFPFISSLEAWPISYGMYTNLNQDLGWMTTYRYDYGPNNGILGYWGGDEYNRIWEPISVAGAVNASGGSTSLCDENPPDSTIGDAIEAQDSITSLLLPFNPVKAATPIYIEAYFTQMDSGISDVRSFEMYVAGISVATITPSDFLCTTQPVPVQVSDSNLTIELRPTPDSTLPPIVSAIEIYTATDPLITTGTDQNDLNGLMNFTNTYDRLNGWSGEPCLPTDTVWQWLSCAATRPPRVTSLYLSGYQLNGNLTNFSQMQALVDIDLSNNNLSGEIPAFLGKLPNLRKLNLSYNDFSGQLPISIRSNKNLAYDVTGNPNLDYKSGSSKSKAITIGLSVAIPLVVIIILLLLVLWIRAKQRKKQETEPETGNGGINGHQTPQPSAPPEGINGNQAPQPSAPPPNKEDEEEEDCVEVHKMDVDESMAPNMELDELEGLIDEYANDGDQHQQPDDDDDDDDCVDVGDHSPDDQSMVPDLDLEELHHIIHQEKERADELGSSK